MKLIFNDVFLRHETGLHPENPKRLEAFKSLPNTPLIEGKAFLELIHQPAYIEKVAQHSAISSWLDFDTRVSPGSFDAAVGAAAATIMASESGGFALVRPPGHHAYADHGSGFCLFNNIAMATQKMVAAGQRVLIFDFDGHYGDGTANIFYESDQVLYWSLHQYPAFPGNGFMEETGQGKGKGFTINIPLPPESGDDIFLHAIQATLPIVQQFQPDVVAISAGFDAHVYDLLLDLRISAKCYYTIGQLIRQQFDRYFATLEGGYNVEELPKCIYNFLAGINGQAMPYVEAATTSSRLIWEEYELRLHSLFNYLAPYWKL